MPSPSPHDDEATRASAALLGDLTAGIAHELTNPVAAMASALDHLADDLDDLLDSLAHGSRAGDSPAADLRGRIEDARRRIAHARNRPLRASADDRALRRSLAAEVGDDVLARRLLSAGVEDPAEAARLAGDESAIARATHATAVGDALRHLDGGTRQVGALVASIRAHVQADSPPQGGAAASGSSVDQSAPVAQGEDASTTSADPGAPGGGGPGGDPTASVVVADSLRSALTLTEHRRRGIATEVTLADVPPVRAEPGRLDQVWTNVLVNAADAMGGHGTLSIDVSATEDGNVRVVVGNDGPPIPAGDLERIFTRRFTTRSGGSGGGLGLGLALSRDIVEHAGGTMTARSREGLTEMIVELPPGPGAQVADGTAGRETR
ncbi:ATP-binding protein [Georgenia sp. Z1344]|uniref:ATP-binding protein n=1 Tax=Georgenia sp. Z1344 TaxID=3416706 RepID=UPI003CEB7F1A